MVYSVQLMDILGFGKDNSMKSLKFRMIAYSSWILILLNSSCASISNQKQMDYGKLAYSKIASHDLKADVPLGGEYAVGTKIFKDADPIVEAREVFKQSGPCFVASTAWLAPPGIDDMKLAKKILEDKKIKVLKIPATGDVVPSGGKDYQDAAFDYASKFNKEMLILSEKEISK